jgi:small subunit ribosomal protein S5
VAKQKVSDLNLKDKIVYVGRTAKVVKGGRRFNFSAMVVVGDEQGHVGYGLGKAGEVSNAVTIPHEVIGRFGAAKVLIRPATPGTGVIAAGGVRAILELAGVKDVLTKSQGSSNPHNTVKATMDALMQLEDASAVAARRGVSIEKVLQG